MAEIRYVSEVGTFLVKKPGDKPRSPGSVQLLLGARLHLDLAGTVDGFAPAASVPREDGTVRTGYVDLSRVSSTQQLKVFYLDVGQGDATIIEAEDVVVVIDGGPNAGFYDELMKRFRAMQRADAALGIAPRQTYRINAVVVSHFDLDHYNGLVRLIRSSDFEIGEIYHNGLPRYDALADVDLDLGDVVNHRDGTKSISTDLRDIRSARELLNSGKLLTGTARLNKFGLFLEAVVEAYDAGRLGGMERLYRRSTDGTPDLLPDTGPDLELEILAPLTTKKTGAVRLPTFPDPHQVTHSNPSPSPSESHTINGNSVVLRLRYGDVTMLFGGDLNQPAQKYLAERYGSHEAFQSDVNKACHHGSSDFDVKYLQGVGPHATVFSSGDNGSHDHPLPDAIGAAAKHSRGEFPLVFSTELIRETGSSGVKLGHVNARSNGREIVMAQKKEKPSLKKTWHAFVLPYPGPFAHE